MKEDLKPCPFCGSRAALRSKRGYRGVVHHQQWYREIVECTKCEARTKEYKRPGEAAPHWNKRTP